MYNALGEYQSIVNADRAFAGQEQDRALRNQLAQYQFAQSERARAERNALAQRQMEMQGQLGGQRIQAQREAMMGRERMMSDRLKAQQGMAQERMNQPQWDSTRGVWVQRPGAGMGGGVTPGMGAGVVRPEGLPPSAGEIKSREAASEKQRTMATYLAARSGLMKGLDESVTGPIMGRLPEFTSAQQVAGGGVAAMAPVLKQIFRVAGEGVFTDKDQQLLIDMIPTRTDRPDAAREKIKNIDRIISSKMGMPLQGGGGGADDPLGLRGGR